MPATRRHVEYWLQNSVIYPLGKGYRVINHLIRLFSPLSGICPAVCYYDRNNCIGGTEAFTHTACKQNISDVITHIDYRFAAGMFKYFLQTPESAFGGRFLMMVGQVLVTDDGLESGNDAVLT